MQTIITATCPLPGFEAVEVDYNMMAPYEDANKFAETLGRDHFEVMVPEVRNWPEAEFPGGPQSKRAPLAWRIWLGQKGFTEATAEFLNAPN